MDKFHAKLFYNIVESQGEKVVGGMVKDWDKLLKWIAGSVTWLFYLYPSATDYGP